MLIGVDPHKVMTFEEFRSTYGHDSIAIDGFVAGPPVYDLENRLINLNHHDGSPRLETRATCAQALMLSRIGLKDFFPDNFIVHTNDCDEDVCLTCHILSDLCHAEQLYNPLLNMLVDFEDKLDASCGAYPVKCSDPSFLKICWVFEPYRSFRNLGGLEFGSPEDFLGIIGDVGRRIQQFLMGRAGEAKLKLQYEVIKQTPRAALLKEIGAQCRYKIFEDGIDLFISVRPNKNVTPNKSGNNVVVIVKKSPFVKINFEALTSKLNELEGAADKLQKWGGGDFVIGSPRGVGTDIPVEEIFKLVEAYRK